MRFLRSQLPLIILGALVFAGCGGTTGESNKQVAKATTRAEVAVRQTSGRDERTVPRFVPPTYREGDRLVLPVTFTDGTRAKLIYPPELNIAELGVTPYGSGSLHGKSPVAGRGDVVARDFRILYGDLDDVLAFVNGGASPRVLARFAGADGQMVGFWDIGLNDAPDYLGFQFGRWTVLVYDYAGAAAMTDAERASWSASFSGRETEDGFLLLEGSGPLRLAGVGEHAGPELSFGTAEPERGLTLFPGRCGPPRDQTRPVHGKLVQWRSGFADWCLSDSMRIQATGRDAFIGSLIRHLAVRDVDLGETGERPREAHR